MKKGPGLKDAIFHKMKKHKMKLTRQREKIIDSLLQSHHPQTAEDIMARLKKSKEAVGCDLVTIYRTLHQFEKINLVQKSFFSENSAQYCINDLADHEHHHHFLCKKCQKITEIDSCLIENQTKLLEKKGFREISHRLEFFGLCPQCAN
jgi:Fur family ferric uptake transcriptional regulator